MFKIVTCLNAEGESPFQSWFDKQNADVRARILIRLDRIEDGNFGDRKSVKGDVYEIRIRHGRAYRVYYGIDGNDVVVLLVGGSKDSKKRQSADIAAAKALWAHYLDYKRSNPDDYSTIQGGQPT